MNEINNQTNLYSDNVNSGNSNNMNGQMYNNFQTAQPSNQAATGSLVTGILSLISSLFGCCFWPVPAVISIVLGIVAIATASSAQKRNIIRYTSAGKTLGILGIIFSILCILFVLCLGGVASITGEALENASKGSSSTSTVSNWVKNEPATSEKVETIYNIGDAVQNEGYEYTVTSVEEKSKVGGKYFSSEPAEGGTYVCINTTLKNISSEPLDSWDFPTVYLIDSNGVKYSNDISASSYYATETDPNRKILSDLNPGITTKDSDVYEISKESYANGEWYLLIDNKIKIKIK